MLAHHFDVPAVAGHHNSLMMGLYKVAEETMTPRRNTISGHHSTTTAKHKNNDYFGNNFLSPQPNQQSKMAEIRYPDFEQWLQTAGNISYVTSVMLARSKSESTLSEISDMTNHQKGIFPLLKKRGQQTHLNYQDIGKGELRDGIRQHHVALLRWTNLVGRLSKQLSSAFGEFSNQLEQTVVELRNETEKINHAFHYESIAKNAKPPFILGRTLDKIWLTVLDNVSDQARIFGDLSKTLTQDFSPSFSDLIDHHEKFIGQIYSFECGLEQLLTDYHDTTTQSLEKVELLAKPPPGQLKNLPKNGPDSSALAIDAQNSYVLNLHNYNSMVTQYENTLMPIVVEEMEEASTDLMAHGVKYLETITQLVGKRYGELKGRMEVVEYACRYQSKARSDISAYVRAYLNANRRHQRRQVLSQHQQFVLIPVSPKSGELVVVDENQPKFNEAVEALNEEIGDMTDLRREKQVELEMLEEKYHACISSINTVASNGSPSNKNNNESGSGGRSSSGHHRSTPSADKDALAPSFSSVTLTLKENIADDRRMVTLATAKLNSLQHQMDLISAARRQPPPVITLDPGDNLSTSALDNRPRRNKAKGLRRSLSQWFSFLTVSPNNNGNSIFQPSADFMTASISGKNTPHFLVDHPGGNGDYPDEEYHPNFRQNDNNENYTFSSKIRSSSNGNLIDNNNDGVPSPSSGEGQLSMRNEDGSPIDKQNDSNKEKTTIFSVKGFKKTFDRLRRIASEEHPQPPKRRRDPHRAQSQDPDPVYALLKCAATLHSTDLETHASSCTCEDCPARRLIAGVSASLLPAQLALSLPGSSFHYHDPQQSSISSSPMPNDRITSSLLLPEHPAHFSRNRVSSLILSNNRSSVNAAVSNNNLQQQTNLLRR